MAAVVGLEGFDIEAVEVPCLHSRWIAALAARRLVLVVSVVVDLDLHADPVLDWSECCLGETQDSQGLSQDGWKAMVRLDSPVMIKICLPAGQRRVPKPNDLHTSSYLV